MQRVWRAYLPPTFICWFGPLHSFGLAHFGDISLRQTSSPHLTPHTHTPLPHATFLPMCAHPRPLTLAFSFSSPLLSPLSLVEDGFVVERRFVWCAPSPRPMQFYHHRQGHDRQHEKGTGQGLGRRDSLVGFCAWWWYSSTTPHAPPHCLPSYPAYHHPLPHALPPPLPPPTPTFPLPCLSHALYVLLYFVYVISSPMPHFSALPALCRCIVLWPVAACFGSACFPCLTPAHCSTHMTDRHASQLCTHLPHHLPHTHHFALTLVLDRFVHGMCDAALLLVGQDMGRCSQYSMPLFGHGNFFYFGFVCSLVVIWDLHLVWLDWDSVLTWNTPTTTSLPTTYGSSSYNMKHPLLYLPVTFSQDGQALLLSGILPPCCCCCLHCPFPTLPLCPLPSIHFCSHQTYALPGMITDMVFWWWLSLRQDGQGIVRQACAFHALHTRANA